MTDSKIFLDTNILVYATLEDFDRNKHSETKDLIDEYNKHNNQFYVSTQILREFYAVVTNKKFLSQPLSPQKAAEIIEVYRKNIQIVDITETVIEQLMILVKEYNIIGQKIHDATIIATMLVNNISSIATYNIRDFQMIHSLNIINPGHNK